MIRKNLVVDDAIGIEIWDGLLVIELLDLGDGFVGEMLGAGA